MTFSFYIDLICLFFLTGLTPFLCVCLTHSSLLSIQLFALSVLRAANSSLTTTSLNQVRDLQTLGLPLSYAI